VPNGFQNFSENIPDLVETSLNLGAVSLKSDLLLAHLLIRSNSSDKMHVLIEKLEKFSCNFEASCSFDSEYPAWEYRENSPLRELAIETFTKLYGKAPIVSAIHAGLECGIFSKKINNADIISFGPDIENIHTPAERMNIASVERTWNYLKEILRKLK
ncbi:MAG: M20/M25/M40 family metallo-hydrolase, partial [Ruminococcus sp.]|nr:M20/M25/M40 family metallo-hydrolase [Ruminococcus sp.]